MAPVRQRPAKRGARLSVFLNCPFDDAYQPLYRAIVFAIVACGYRPRCALESLDGAEYRLDKIARMIGDCDWGIHDISRVEVDRRNAMPRFNMPMELGIHLGARFLGEGRHKRKRALVLETEAHRYDQTLSDISGQDIAYHRNKPALAIAAVREFFNNHRPRGAKALPGAEALAKDYARIQRSVGPQLAREQRLGRWDDLSFRDYVETLEDALVLLTNWRARKRV